MNANIFHFITSLACDDVMMICC